MGKARLFSFSRLARVVATAALVMCGGLATAPAAQADGGVMWYQTNYNTSSPSSSFGWGADSKNDCTPITGDWDGDDDTTVGVACFGSAGWTWTQTNYNTSSGANSFGWGGTNRAGCKPITGDWDGDGDTTVGLACFGSSGWFWYQTQSNVSSPSTNFGWGGTNRQNCLPITGDWDGDGDDTVGLSCFGSAGWTWYQTNSNVSSPSSSFGWAGPDRSDCAPMTGDWDGDADTTVGLACYGEDGWTWHQTNYNTSSGSGSFGWAGSARSGYSPITGDWDGDGDTTVGLTSANPNNSATPPPPSANCSAVTQPVPESVVVGASGFHVHPCLQSSTNALVAAASSAGITLTGGAWRSVQSQIILRMQNCGTSDYAIYDMPASQCSPPTARPGTSMHERGLAFDFHCNNGPLITSHSSPCFIWLDAHAAQYGLYNLPSEPWHWSTNGH